MGIPTIVMTTGEEIETETETGKEASEEAGVGVETEMIIESDQEEVDPETSGMEGRKRVGDETHPYIGMFLHLDMSMLHHYNSKPCKLQVRFLQR